MGSGFLESMQIRLVGPSDGRVDEGGAASATQILGAARAIVIREPGRQHLTSRAETDWVMFQDSDDAPCSDRIGRLISEATDCDLLGSHDVRFDEFREVAYPVRYPLDVNPALAQEGGHSLLHPTSMVRAWAFVRSGGFSTQYRTSSDTQFLLRAHFSMRIRNVDAFLYVKRDRAGSLTRDPATALGSPERVALQSQWKSAFFDVCRAEAALVDSALRAEYRNDIATEPVD
jgi:hypothetical protein